MAMRAAVMMFQKPENRSVIPSARIARCVAERLGLPLIGGPEIADYTDLDVLFIVNGAYAFCSFLQETASAIRTAHRVVWVQNDYTIIPPKEDSGAESPFRKAFAERKKRGLASIDYWTTVRSTVREGRDAYVNWNRLQADPLSDAEYRAARGKRNNDLVYYGSYRHAGGRSSRQKYFDRYFREPKVNVVISSPSKKFSQRYDNVNIDHFGPFEGRLATHLALYGSGLYIEDQMSHEQFHSPPCRFYEMLGAGLPMIFQPEAGATLRRAGLGDVESEGWTAATSLEVARRHEHRETIGLRQRERWLNQLNPKLLDDQIEDAWNVTKGILACTSAA